MGEMKKVLEVRNFADAANASHEGALPVLFCRSNKLFVANLTFQTDKVSFEWDKAAKVATIRVKLNESEMLAIADASGIADKVTIEDNR